MTIEERWVMDLRELARGSAISLETRKRDGSWVATPVSLVVDGGRAFFKSYDPSGKAKRLRNFPEVRVAPCTSTGRVTGARVAGRATLLSGADAERARRLLARRHPLLQGVLVPVYHKIKGLTTLFYELTLERS
jgi:PPOX class probable F420-dependent enzyme